MKILSKERVIFGAIIILLIGALAFAAGWFTSNYVLIAVPKEAERNVEVCINNHVACSLIYESKEEIRD